MTPSPEPQAHDHATAADGWTFVKPKRSRRNQPSRPARISPASATPARRTGPLRSVPDIAAEYRALRAAWESSPACRALRALVAAAAAAAAPVTQAVCLGIGTFDPADGGWEARRRTYVQLIAFLVMVDELERTAGGTVPCVFQEPVFTAADRSFIASLGHQVVDSPAGCARVDASTLLFGVHLYRPVYALALRNGPPAVFVGTGWDVWDQVSLAGEAPDLAGLEAMEQTYEKAAFPQDALGTAFSSTSVYWRPAAGGEPAPGRDSVADARDELTDRLASVSIT